MRRQGYAYEAAGASFELLARRVLGRVPDYFAVEKFDVSVEQRINAMGQRITVSMAVVKVKVGEESLISAAPRRRWRPRVRCKARRGAARGTPRVPARKMPPGAGAARLVRVLILNGGTEPMAPPRADRAGQKQISDALGPRTASCFRGYWVTAPFPGAFCEFVELESCSQAIEEIAGAPA